MSVGIDRGREWLRGSAWGFALLLAACGGTSQQSGGGGSSNQTAGGAAGGAAVGGGGMQGQGDTACPKSSVPAADTACAKEGLVCDYPGNPCGPENRKFVCEAGKWVAHYSAPAGICFPEACAGLNPGTGCPFNLPAPGMGCGGQCLLKTTCEYPEATASCVAGTWQVQSSGGAAGAGGNDNAAGASDEAAGGWGGAP